MRLTPEKKSGYQRSARRWEVSTQRVTIGTPKKEILLVKVGYPSLLIFTRLSIVGTLVC